MGRWREIPSAPGYSVSDSGEVASTKYGGWRILRAWLTGGGGGYRRIALYVGGVETRRTGLIHLFVAEAFLGPRPTTKHEVNHKNGVSTDNRAENLEWVTSSENKRHALAGPRPVRGERVGSAKLTETKVIEIRARRRGGETLSSIAASYGISDRAAGDVAAGRSWAWLEEAT